MISKNIIKLDYTFKIVCAGNYFYRSNENAAFISCMIYNESDGGVTWGGKGGLVAGTWQDRGTIALTFL